MKYNFNDPKQYKRKTTKSLSPKKSYLYKVMLLADASSSASLVEHSRL